MEIKLEVLKAFDTPRDEVNVTAVSESDFEDMESQGYVMISGVYWACGVQTMALTKSGVALWTFARNYGVL